MELRTAITGVVTEEKHLAIYQGVKIGIEHGPITEMVSGGRLTEHPIFGSDLKPCTG